MTDPGFRERIAELHHALRSAAAGDSTPLPPWIGSKTLDQVRGELNLLMGVLATLESFKVGPLFLSKADAQQLRDMPAGKIEYLDDDKQTNPVGGC